MFTKPAMSCAPPALARGREACREPPQRFGKQGQRPRTVKSPHPQHQSHQQTVWRTLVLKIQKTKRTPGGGGLPGPRVQPTRAIWMRGGPRGPGGAGKGPEARGQAGGGWPPRPLEPSLKRRPSVCLSGSEHFDDPSQCSSEQTPFRSTLTI